MANNLQFLSKLLNSFNESDFYNDQFLTAFYKFYKKYKHTDLFECYIEYLTRNRNFPSVTEREIFINELCADLKNNILLENTNVMPNVKKITINKTKVLTVLSSFIKDSIIINYVSDAVSDVADSGIDYEQNSEHAESVMDEINKLLLNSTSKKDVSFGKRVDMLNVWHDTEQKCRELLKDAQLSSLVSKIYFIDTNVINQTVDNIQTVDVIELRDTLPSTTIAASYTKSKYNTTVNIVQKQPVEVAVEVTRKNKAIYICAGSSMVVGGNADQGIDVVESILYMTSTYSLSIEKALQTYPLDSSHVIVCPNVLVFKDVNYKQLPLNQWQRISVLNAPSKWRPKLTSRINLPNGRLLCNQLTGQHNTVSNSELDFYDKNTTFLNKEDEQNEIKALTYAIETSLFLGYDSIILDDRAILDNNAPAHDMARIIKMVIAKFDKRIREFHICITNAKMYEIVKQVVNEI